MVMVNVIAEHVMAQLAAEERAVTLSFSFTTSTTEPNVIIEKMRNASHCTNRGDLVSADVTIIDYSSIDFLG